MCNQMNITNYTVETDCSMAYHMVTNPSTEQWQYAYILRRIRLAIVEPTRLRLIFREANKVADLMAKMALQLESRIEFYRSRDLPMAIQRCIFIDRLGIPLFRSHCN